MITIANADARHIPLPDRKVQCIVTSPPYWGLRDYGTATWEGGSAECDHRQPNDAPNGNKGQPVEHAGRNSWECRKCGARRIDAQIGLEASPAVYVAAIVAVMRECWRVLKDDGVMWLNLGDSYAGGGVAGSDKAFNGKQGTNRGSVGMVGKAIIPDGLKPKDLCGIPWRVAFALQDDGWYLRQDIIWHKPNPIPESVTDRCTKAHEYVFLLTKQARYYYDAEAIAEQALQPNGIAKETAQHKAAILGQTGGTLGTNQGASTRNRRSVWTVATQPYSGSHFAVFPMALIEPMILAGSRSGDVVLDPFAGSGTTGAVAVKHGRRAVLLDLNTKYIDLQFERTNGVQMVMP